MTTPQRSTGPATSGPAQPPIYPIRARVDIRSRVPTGLPAARRAARIPAGQVPAAGLPAAGRQSGYQQGGYQQPGYQQGYPQQGGYQQDYTQPGYAQQATRPEPAAAGVRRSAAATGSPCSRRRVEDRSDCRDRPRHRRRVLCRDGRGRWSNDDSSSTTTTTAAEDTRRDLDRGHQGQKERDQGRTRSRMNQPVRDGKFEFVVKKVEAGLSSLGESVMTQKAQGSSSS